MEEVLQQQQWCKSDGIYYHCFSKTANSCKCSLLFHALKSLLFAVAIPVLLISQEEVSSVMTLCLLANLLASAINLAFAAGCLSKLFTSSQVYLEIAQ